MTLSGSDSIGSVKHGRDKKLEDEANKWLAKNVGDNERSAARDAEKMSYEHGFITAEQLRYYDPTDDWTTADSVYAIPISPSDVDVIEPTICAGTDDGNVRARNTKLADRRALMRHIDDVSGWGSADESIPLLGANEGERKTCTRCGRSKGLDCFYSHPRTRDGLQSQCKPCQKVKNANPGE